MNTPQLRSNALKIKGELKKCQTGAGHLYNTALIHYDIIYKLADLVENIINTMDENEKEKGILVSEVSVSGDTYRTYITNEKTKRERAITSLVKYARSLDW